jgi:hypothetical protein
MGKKTQADPLDEQWRHESGEGNEDLPGLGRETADDVSQDDSADIDDDPIPYGRDSTDQMPDEEE